MKDSFSSTSSDMHGRIQEDRNFLQRLMSKIPGFSGYMDAKERRQADQLLRETIASRLEQIRLTFNNIQQDLSGDIIKAITHAEPMGRVDNGLMGLIGKIKDAPQGYSGFFDAVKVDSDTLDQIYQFDDAMLLQADYIASCVAALAKAVDDDEDIRGAIRTLDKAVKEANEKFATRHEVMIGFTG